MPTLVRGWGFLIGVAAMLLVSLLTRVGSAFPGERNTDARITRDDFAQFYITTVNVGDSCSGCHSPLGPTLSQAQVNPVLTISGGTGSGFAFSVKPKATATFTLKFNNGGPSGSGGFLVSHELDPHLTANTNNLQGKLGSVPASGSHDCPNDPDGPNGDVTPTSGAGTKTPCGPVTNTNDEVMHSFPQLGATSTFQFTYTAPAVCTGIFNFRLYVNAENGDSKCAPQGDSPYTIPFTISINCDDGDTCNGTETCNGTGACQPGSDRKVCPGENQCQNAPTCVNSTCTNLPKTGQPCEDGDLCTTGELCTSSGTCPKGAPVVCPAPATPACQNAGMCNNGTCTYAPKAGTCNDNNACTSNDVCQGDGTCKGTGMSIDDGEVCTTDSCTALGGVKHDPADPSTICRAASCSNGPPSQSVSQATCNGAKTCPDSIIVSCNGQLCAGTVCSGGGTGCAGDDSKCVAGDFCLGTTCTPKFGPGQACAGNNFCQTNFCVDGVCCDKACGNSSAADCQACNVPGKVGTCSPSVGNQCRAPANNSVCDVAEACGGTALTCPADGFAAATVSCRSASCTAGVATLAANCPGPTVSGACPAVQTRSCSPYAGCAGAACAATCAAKADCVNGFFCNASNKCVAELPVGGACTAAAQCGTGICVDGRCCNSQCTGQCQACDVASAPGLCSPITDKVPHGSRPKCTGDGSACQGSCDGVNTASCVLPGSTTACRGPSCTASTATLAASCNGRGSCPAAQTQACAPGVCQAATGPKAICIGTGGTPCTEDVACQSDHFCSAGVCIAKIDDGATCAADSQCKNAHCVDGLCCNSDCNGQCEACDAPGSLGKCTAVTDPPHGGRPACVSDPQYPTCAGSCNGKNRLSCTFPGPGTSCRDASCTKAVATLLASCTGTGTCSPAQTQDCPALVACNDAGTACADGCSADRDCAMGKYCAGGVCVPTLPPGSQCSTNAQCVGACVDGVCCGSVCDHQCEACNIPGKEGICTPVKGAPVGLRQACASDGNAACAGACDGTNRNACVFPAGTKQCSAGACANGIATLTEFCDGSGSCPTAQHQICAPADCVGTKCGGDCASAACTGQNYCSAGVCVPKLPTGSRCGADAQCGNGLCTDGFCCNVACDGACQACDVPGFEGSCTTLSTDLPHGGRAACPGFGACGSTCNGSSATDCAYATMITTCGKSSCAADGDELAAPVCNGVGVCLPAQSTNCGAYTCDPPSGACLTSCVLDTDCAPGLTCVNAKCQLSSDAGSADSGAPDGSLMTDAGTDGAVVDATAPDSGRDSGNGNGSAGEGASPEVPAKNDAKNGCGCSVPGSETRGPSFALLAGLALLGVASRRRRAARAERAASPVRY